MRFFSSIFGGGKSRVVSGKNPPKGFIEAANFAHTKGGFAGGYGAWTFGNIIRAHSDAEEIVDEFNLDNENAEYGNCWQRAYSEALKESEQEAMIFALMGMDFELEDFIDWEEVEETAHEYAIELAESWISGSTWIPYEVLEWAYYDISDHNG